MNFSPQDNSPQSLREHFEKQKALVEWQEIEKFFAQGAVIDVSAKLDLVEVALAFCADQKEQVEIWMQNKMLQRVSDKKAIALSAGRKKIYSLVVAPWILIQEHL